MEKKVKHGAVESTYNSSLSSLKGKVVESVTLSTFDGQVNIKFTDGTTMCIIALSDDAGSGVDIQVY
jgi:hypothetical protein